MWYEMIFHNIHGNFHESKSPCLAEFWRRYWFPNCEDFLENFIKTCRVCEFKKDKLKNKAAKKMPSVILYEENPLDRL